MIRAAFRDLSFRRRRFAIAVVGAALVFALSLVVQGLAQSFDDEVSTALEVAGVGRWFVSEGSSGPFTSFTPIGPEVREEIAADASLPVSELLLIRQPIGVDDELEDGGLIGVVPGSLGSPTELVSGRAVAHDGEAVVSTRLEAALGSLITVGGENLEVVGLVDATLLAGSSNVYTTLTQAQAILGAGPIVTVLATREAPDAVPAELTMMTNSDVHTATLRPLEDAIGTIETMRTILWLVAALIVGAILYLNASERDRDVAVLKAIGVTSGSIAGSMMIQAAVIALISGLLADLMAVLVAPLFPMSVTLRPEWMLLMPVVAVLISCLACLVAVRRALKCPPALAFGGA